MSPTQLKKSHKTTQVVSEYEIYIFDNLSDFQS